MKKEIQLRPNTVNTPWGFADWCTHYADGIDSYCTPGHGGFRLSVVRRMQMPAGLREFVGYGGPGWYEEDCDWAVVALSFPQVFEPMDVWAAVRTVQGFSDGYGESVKAWLESPVASIVHAIAAAFVDENAKKFTAGCEGTINGGHGWFIEARTVDRLETVLFDFPIVPRLPSPFTRQDAEEAGGKERKPLREILAVAFNEADCGGVFDGVGTVTSDADPGL